MFCYYFRLNAFSVKGVYNISTIFRKMLPFVFGLDKIFAVPWHVVSEDLFSVNNFLYKMKDYFFSSYVDYCLRIFFLGYNLNKKFFFKIDLYTRIFNKHFTLLQAGLSRYKFNAQYSAVADVYGFLLGIDFSDLSSYERLPHLIGFKRLRRPSEKSFFFKEMNKLKSFLLSTKVNNHFIFEPKFTSFTNYDDIFFKLGYDKWGNKKRRYVKFYGRRGRRQRGPSW
jgi:hypothetical protein